MAKSSSKKIIDAGMSLCDRMNEIGIPTGWFDCEKVNAFASYGFVLVVDRSNPGTPSFRLINPDNQSEVIA